MYGYSAPNFIIRNSDIRFLQKPSCIPPTFLSIEICATLHLRCLRHQGQRVEYWTHAIQVSLSCKIILSAMTSCVEERRLREENSFVLVHRTFYVSCELSNPAVILFTVRPYNVGKEGVTGLCLLELWLGSGGDYTVLTANYFPRAA
jgi:hypothetical protein